MLRKALAFVLAIAIVVSMLIVPVNAQQVLPTGDYFTLSTEHVDSFSAGDTVEITFTITDVPEDVYLLTVDLDFWYDETILTPVKDSFTSTCDDVNASTAEDDAWEMLSRVDAGGNIYVGFMEDSDNYIGSNASGVISGTLVFTALRDGTAGDLLLYSTCCEALSIDFEDGTGNGMEVYVEGPVVTEAPTEEPTAEPFDAANPVIDIDFTTDTKDKKEVLSYKQTSDMFGYEYTGNVTLSDSFALEIQGTFGYGIVIYGTAYQLETYGYGMIESWWTETVNPHIIANNLDMSSEHHIVLVGDVNSYKMYIDGQLVVSQDDVTLSDNWTLAGDDNFMSVGLGTSSLNLFRVYSGAPTDEEVLALYETVAPSPTPVQTEAPTEVPTVTPVPTPEMPTGDYFTLTTSDVEAFKAGDTVEITFTLNDIPEDKYLLTVDLYFWYDETILSPNKDAFTSTCDKVNASTAEDDAWEMLYRVDANGGLMVCFMEDSDNWIGSNQSGAISATLVFTALNDSEGGDLLLYSTECEAMTIDFEEGTGNGMAVYAKESVSEILMGYLGIEAKPNKLFYNLGEELDLTGLVTGMLITDEGKFYPDGEVTIDTSEFDNTKVGSYKINLSYEYNGNVYANYFTVHVIDATPEVVISGVQLLAKPSNTIYYVGDELDTTGLTLRVKYSDGTYTDITEGFEVTGYDNTVAGAQKLTVTYEGKTNVFTVHVLEVPEVTVRSVRLVAKPSKTFYNVGDEFDATGLVLTAFYTDGTSATITEGFEVTGFDSSVADSIKLTVTYEGHPNVFTVHII